METATKFVKAIDKAIIDPLLGLIFIVALFMFILGAVRYMRAEASSADRIKGRQHMIWGILGIVAMVSVYGILAILLRTVGVSSGDLGPVQNAVPL